MSKIKTFRMSDSVLHRFVQIVQEAFLTGTDVSDHLRMVEMKMDETDSHMLVLTDEYVDMVRKQHESMLQFLETQKKAVEAIKTEGTVLESTSNASSLILNDWDKNS